MIYETASGKGHTNNRTQAMRLPEGVTPPADYHLSEPARSYKRHLLTLDKELTAEADRIIRQLAELEENE